MKLFWQYNKGILIGDVNAGQASPSSGSRLARAVVGRAFVRLRAREGYGLTSVAAAQRISNLSPKKQKH
jgi:hypothetical protein